MLRLFMLLCAVQAQFIPPSAGKQMDESNRSLDEEKSAKDWRFQLNAYERWLRICTNSKPTANAEILTRIAGGNLAESDMFPYQVGLLLLHPPAMLSQCGGALISEQYILTAAHCLVRARLARIYLGALRYADDMNATAIFDVTRRNFIINEHYAGSGGLDDIALIELPTKVQLSVSVQPIKLASSAMDQSLMPGNIATTSGWGYVSDAAVETGQTNRLLNYVDVPLLEQDACICSFLPGLVNESKHICTSGAGGRGGCAGDSGGPLVYYFQNESYLIGITSFGSAGGCEIGAPTVYIRVAEYSAWILQKMGQKIVEDWRR